MKAKSVERRQGELKEDGIRREDAPRVRGKKGERNATADQEERSPGRRRRGSREGRRVKQSTKNEEKTGRLTRRRREG